MSYGRETGVLLEYREMIGRRILSQDPKPVFGMCVRPKMEIKSRRDDRGRCDG